jgi:hypothetical protein
MYSLISFRSLVEITFLYNPIPNSHHQHSPLILLCVSHCTSQHTFSFIYTSYHMYARI